MIECRAGVRAFAKIMEEKLKKHDRKKGRKGWKGMDPDRLLNMASLELKKLIVAVRLESKGEVTPGQVAREAADIANFCMMIADVCGGLE